MCITLLALLFGGALTTALYASFRSLDRQREAAPMGTCDCGAAVEIQRGYPAICYQCVEDARLR